MAYLDIIPLADAKIYLRIDDTLTEDDTQITRMINVALSYVERYTNHVLFAKEKTYRLINGCISVYDYPIKESKRPNTSSTMEVFTKEEKQKAKRKSKK